MALGKGIPVINGFDLNSKLPLDSRAVVDTTEEMNALVTNEIVGDGQLCYCKADKKLYVLKDNVWSEVGGGGGIPVVEGTVTEETAEGITITIPETQTSPFILHSDIGYLFIDTISGMYSATLSTPYDQWFLISGNETVITISDYTPASFYSTSIEGYVPSDETTSVDITFPALDRLKNSICVVQDRDNTKVFLKNRDSHNLGRFQTPIICKDNGTYRCWYIEGKEGDDTGTLATVKCKIVNMGGSVPDNVVLYGDLTPVA